MSIGGGGEQVFFLRASGPDDPVLCLWCLETATGEESLLADPRLIGAEAVDADDAIALPPEEQARRERARESAEGIVAYTLSHDASLAVFVLDGSVYTVDTQSAVVTKLATADGVFDPRINSSGTHVAYVSGQELRTVHLTTNTGLLNGDPAITGSDRLVLDDANELRSWGRAEFIAGEEMGRTRGFWWSPSGDALLATRVDEQPVNRRWISDPANPDRQPTEVRYPSAGSANAIVDLAFIRVQAAGEGATNEGEGIADLIEDAADSHESNDGLNSQRGCQPRFIDWREGQYEYLADVQWHDQFPPLIIRQTRDQRVLSIAELDLASLTLREVRRIEDDHWVELVPGSPMQCAQGLLTIEDRGDIDQRALCLDGNVLDSSGFQVRSIVSVDENHALVTGSVDPTEIHLATISLFDGSITLLTSEPGVHRGIGVPGTLVRLSNLPDEPDTRVFVEHWGPEPAKREPSILKIRSYAGAPSLQARPIYLELGPSNLRSALFFPDGFDNEANDAASLPVLLDPYGGPHAQRVLKSQNAHLVSQWFANQGFVVLVTDGRGTPGRGPTFERSVWGDLAQPVLDDQLDALDDAADRYPALDLQRVGIRGWSFGGYLAALAVLRRPDRFHAAVAGAPVTTWHLYDTHYTERYLGHPADYPQHYDQSDLILEAETLGSPLLLIHGLADDNVVAAHTLRFSSALLAAGRPHQVLPLSGVTHMTPQEVVAENLLLLQRDFFQTHLRRSAIPEPEPSTDSSSSDPRKSI